MTEKKPVDSENILDSVLDSIFAPRETVDLKIYLDSIKDIELPERFSQITKDFVDYVVSAHSWYKYGIQQQRVGIENTLIGFNFFIGPGPLIEAEGGINERVFEEFQNLKYGVVGGVFDVENKIPREIYDAGLAIVPCNHPDPANYSSDMSKNIMVVTIAKMLKAIDYYRELHKTIKV